MTEHHHVLLVRAVELVGEELHHLVGDVASACTFERRVDADDTDVADALREVESMRSDAATVESLGELVFGDATVLLGVGLVVADDADEAIEPLGDPGEGLEIAAAV